MTAGGLWRRWWGRGWIRRPIKSLIIPLLVVYGLIEVVDSVVMPRLTRHGQEFPAPTLVGITMERAQSDLLSLGSTMEIAERRYSADQPDGTILEQRPAAGAPIKQGRNFKVVISRGSELVEVPRVRGFTVRQAELILVEAGFAVGGRAPSPDSSVPLGNVVGTVPAPGSRLPKSGVVNLLVNQEPREDYTWCPNLTGVNIEAARDLLRERGLLLGMVGRRFDSTAAAGTVVEQSQAPGDEIPLGSEVDLVISRESETTSARSSDSVATRYR
ncbi:MAG: PASTA domain-containing protein [candidate division Zixibacteria bacterium]|nr:PASTA domain-containing protein [candidate division Zixibacteria bacterium]